MKYEYKKVKGYKEKKFIENGHTMFEEDVLTRLQRLAYLEEKQKDNRSNLRKCILNKNNTQIEVFFHLFGFDSDSEPCAVLETMEGDLLTEYSSNFKFVK